MSSSRTHIEIYSSMFQKFRTEIIPVKCPLCGAVPKTFPSKNEILKCEFCTKGYYKLKEDIDEKSINTMISGILKEFSSDVVKSFEDKMNVKLQDVLYEYYQTFQQNLKDAYQQEGKITRDTMEKLFKNLDNRMFARLEDLQEGIKDVKGDTEYIKAEIRELREHFTKTEIQFITRTEAPKPKGKREEDITEEDLNELKFT